MQKQNTFQNIRNIQALHIVPTEDMNAPADCIVLESRCSKTDQFIIRVHIISFKKKDFWCYTFCIFLNGLGSIFYKTVMKQLLLIDDDEK